MDAAGGRTPFFVSRHHERQPATLEELLRASAKLDPAAGKSDGAQRRGIGQELDANDDDSDSDYHCEVDEDNDDGDDDWKPEVVDEWRLHATEPREGLYLHEMRRQRGRIDEKEAQWVRGYIKAQRAWKARTGRSIDEFQIPGRLVRRSKKPGSTTKIRSGKPLQTLEDEEEPISSLFTGVTRLEALLLLAAAVFVCLSLGVQLYVSIGRIY
ncbi:unnamed protein product [Phytophthora lilii]|uniref:Unnamed protein product n=1 Tax=Phytophthora lilii TaxID=2077276 RepID=A0A9W6WU12_9STRA|nr:unnamed protein product [Phytophthora lilii]